MANFSAARGTAAWLATVPGLPGGHVEPSHAPQRNVYDNQV